MGFRVGEVGSKYTRAIVDETGAVVDISTATIKQIWFVKGDGTSVKKDAQFVTDGTAGLLRYTWVAGDLNSRGGWRSQAYVVLANGETYHTSVHEFTVEENIIAT